MAPLQSGDNPLFLRSRIVSTNPPPPRYPAKNIACNDVKSTTHSETISDFRTVRASILSLPRCIRIPQKDALSTWLLTFAFQGHFQSYFKVTEWSPGGPTRVSQQGFVEHVVSRSGNWDQRSSTPGICPESWRKSGLYADLLGYHAFQVVFDNQVKAFVGSICERHVSSHDAIVTRNGVIKGCAARTWYSNLIIKSAVPVQDSGAIFLLDLQRPHQSAVGAGNADVPWNIERMAPQIKHEQTHTTDKKDTNK